MKQYIRKHWSISEKHDINKVLYLLIDRPNKIDHFGDFIWYKIKHGPDYRDYNLPSRIGNNYVRWTVGNTTYSTI